MTYRVTVTNPAEYDLQEIILYIDSTLKNRTAALALLNDAENAFASLEEMPYRHALVNNEILAGRGVRGLTK